MIIPCIDLQGGKAVQLVQGRRLKLSVDDVLGLLERFREYPILHVIDLDAALRKGSNSQWIKTLCKRGKMKVRVGGGIRTIARADKILSWGAEKVIIGSAAFENGKVRSRFLEKLAEKVGKQNLIIALDTYGGHIVVRGWREKLKLKPKDVIPQLEPYCAEFLSTFVDNEGTMRGTDLSWFRKMRRATLLPVTAAGGIRSMREVRALGKMGMDAAVGMAIYTGKLAADKTGFAKQ
jgi:phosphoribosylformimino-5-aminoimidazole carboxamide ribotide isomerase